MQWLSEVISCSKTTIVHFPSYQPQIRDTFILQCGADTHTLQPVPSYICNANVAHFFWPSVTIFFPFLVCFHAIARDGNVRMSYKFASLLKRGLRDSEEMCFSVNKHISVQLLLRHILNCHMIGESGRLIVNNLSVFWNFWSMKLKIEVTQGSIPPYLEM